MVFVEVFFVPEIVFGFELWFLIMRCSATFLSLGIVIYLDDKDG